MKTRIAALAAVAVAAGAALPLSAAELAHRWSFNGDYSDSVGGADAVKFGIQRVKIPQGGYALVRKIQ